MALQIHTYTLSNRDGSKVSADITYLSTTNRPGQLYNEYGPQQSLAKQDWIAQLAIDIFAISGGKPVPVALIFHIHGFNTTADDARLGHMQYGAVLAAQGVTPGLVVSASWPGDTATPRGARQNAEKSYALFQEILNSFASVQAALQTRYKENAPRLWKVITCHSMGNYVMSTTLGSGKIHDYRRKVDRVVMLAPDVDRAIFTDKSEVLNQGQAIYDMASGNVQVLWSSTDAILEADEWLGMWYVLGYRGPLPPLAATTRNVSAYDCSRIASLTFSSKYVPAEYEGPPNGITHSACRFVSSLIVPQVDFIAIPKDA